jgi:hypothetical protein
MSKVVCARVTKLMVVTVGSSPKCIKTLGRKHDTTSKIGWLCQT